MTAAEERIVRELQGEVETRFGTASD
jgi:hypothetical protein